MSRLFAHDPDRWLVTGGTALQFRTPAEARATIDLDLAAAASEIADMAVRWTYKQRKVRAMDTKFRRRNRRMDLRTTTEERELIDRAVIASGTDLTDFVVTHASEAARRILADRDHFGLDPSALKQWEALNARPARDLPGLRALMQRPSPFSE